MNSSYGKSDNKTGSTDAFDFDLGLGSGRTRHLNGQRSQTSPYTQQPKTTSSWTHQPNKPAWTHQPATPIQSSGPGSLSGPASMVGDIFGKSWNSSAPSHSSALNIGIVNSKNPNLFGDLLSSAMGPKRSTNNVPLKHSAPIASQNTFQMGAMDNSLPKIGNSGNVGQTRGSNVSNFGGKNVNLGGNSTINPNFGGPPIKNMTESGIGGGAMGSNKDPFGSLVDFGSKPSLGLNSSSKSSAGSDSGSNSKTSNSDPLRDFGFPIKPSENQSQPLKVDDFDALFSSTEQFTSRGVLNDDDDWGINSEFGGGNDKTTTELEGLPPPPAGVSASAAKSKGMDNYKQGQFADAIKWLSWAVILLEKAGDGTTDVLTCRASCYKEVGEYKKAVADCTTVLERDAKNVAVLVQRALLYESMEKYKLGSEDLRTVMNIDPGNRVARSTIHRLTKMAG